VFWAGASADAPAPKGRTAQERLSYNSGWSVWARAVQVYTPSAAVTGNHTQSPKVASKMRQVGGNRCVVETTRTRDDAVRYPRMKPGACEVFAPSGSEPDQTQPGRKLYRATLAARVQDLPTGGTSARCSRTWGAKQTDGVRVSASLGKVPTANFVEGNFTPEGQPEGWQFAGSAAPKASPRKGKSNSKGDGHSSSG
jgi:hypothetical protein